MEGFRQGFGKLREALDANTLDSGVRYKVELVFEEIIANIVRHAALPGEDLHIELSLQLGADSITMQFDDDGIAFDPRGRADPKVPTSLAEAPDGGLGLMIVRRAATAMEYRRTSDGKNHLLVRLPSRGAILTTPSAPRPAG